MRTNLHSTLSFKDFLKLPNSKFQIICLVLIFFSCLPSLVLATTSDNLRTALKVTPVIIPLQLIPSQTISKDIVIENITSSPQPIRAVFSDFQTTGEDGGYEFQQTAKNPLLSWSTISPSELIIPAHSKAKVKLEIKTPNKIPVGGYFGMLFFEPVPQPQSDKNATQVVARIGVLLLGSVGVQDGRQLSIIDFKTPLLSNSGQEQALLRVKNLGLEYITAKPIITIKPMLGKARKTIWEDKVIFPGNVRRWEKGIQLPEWNIYHLELAVSMGEGKFVYDRKTIIVLPYIKVLALTSVLILVILIISKRRRLKKAISILIHNK